jgi:putative DNA primase/helicase
MTIDEAVEQACASVGIRTPRGRAFGRWLKTDTLDGKRGKGDGRVIINEMHATAWNWRTGESVTVGCGSPSNDPERKQRFAQEQAKRRDEEREKAKRAARIAGELIEAARLGEHAYLADKGFKDERAMIVDRRAVERIVGRYLVPDGAAQAIVVPARLGPVITSAQLIWEDGTKKFLFGGEVGGTSHRISTGTDTWLCEGFATGLSVRAALKSLRVSATVLCCFSASNITAVARAVRGRCFIAADHDQPLDQFGGLGAGEHYARQTGFPYGFPPDLKADFNDMHQQAGIFAVQRALTSIMAGRRAA